MRSIRPGNVRSVKQNIFMWICNDSEEKHRFGSRTFDLMCQVNPMEGKGEVDSLKGYASCNTTRVHNNSSEADIVKILPLSSYLKL